MNKKNVIFVRSQHRLKNLQIRKKRYLYEKIAWNNHLIGIKGARGIGKSTLLLQRLKEINLPPQEASYWSLDDLYFTNHNLAETAEQFYNQGGKILFLDEVHKYKGWSRHIKNLYDLFPDLNIVLTGSSIIDIAKEEADLSRRILMYSMVGLSYREYLLLHHNLQLPTLTLEEIILNKHKWQLKFPNSFRPLQYFSDYLKNGYYPFSAEDTENFNSRLQQVIRIIVEYDMAALNDFDIRNAQKLLQLLYIISANVPFKPNISELARKTNIHRNTLNIYLHFLEQAQLIHKLYPSGISVSLLQKPEKIFLNNTNLAFVLAPESVNIRSIREAFFASQLSVNHQLNSPKNGDFIVDNQWTFEIGGKNKTRKQIADIENSFVVVDDIEFPISKLPLWVVGFLY